jgi:DNA-binding transcriptional LysR family regulator
MSTPRFGGLLLQARLYDEFTEHALRSAGLRPGMRVLDVGCGPGDVSFIAARLVGPQGSVLGVNAAHDVIVLARIRAAERGLDSTPKVESIYATDRFSFMSNSIKKKNVDLRRLRYFLTVAEELNYARAARRLRIAGPSLSQQIKTLERELDVRLFERSPRTVKLTPDGAALLPHVRDLVEHADELCRRVSDLASERLIRFGIVDGCPEHLADRVAGMASVSVDTWAMPSHAQASRVAAGNLDLAICHVDTSQLKTWGLTAHLIGVDRLQAICVGSNPSPAQARDVAVLIERDATSWLSWNNYAQEIADTTGALTAQIEDGGITGRAFFEHARRLQRPIVQAPKGASDPLPYDMVRRRIVEPAPLWTWSLVRRRADDRPAIRAIVEALGVVAPSLRDDALWLPHNDPHRAGTA